MLYQSTCASIMLWHQYLIDSSLYVRLCSKNRLFSSLSRVFHESLRCQMGTCQLRAVKSSTTSPRLCLSLTDKQVFSYQLVLELIVINDIGYPLWKIGRANLSDLALGADPICKITFPVYTSLKYTFESCVFHQFGNNIFRLLSPLIKLYFFIGPNHLRHSNVQKCNILSS